MSIQPTHATSFEDVERTLDRLGLEVAALADLVLSPNRLYRVERLYDLLQEVLGASRAVATAASAEAQPGSNLTGIEVPAFRLQRIKDDIELLLQAHQMRCQSLQAQVNARQAEIGTRQNDDMRKISAWAAIVVVPTLITGIYGMNFESMPELGSSLGYPLVVVAIVGISAALYAYFRRIKWL